MLLDRGVHLDLDLVITVAEVPLIAVSLRAALAGVQTMIDWGVPGPWTGLSSRSSVEGLHEPPQAVLPRPEERPSRCAAEFPAAMGERRADGAVWRDGTLLVDADGTIRWRGDGDRRALLRVEPRDLEGVAVEHGAGHPEGRPVVVLQVGGTTERIASPRARAIVACITGTGRGASGGRSTG